MRRLVILLLLPSLALAADPEPAPAGEPAEAAPAAAPETTPEAAPAPTAAEAEAPTEAVPAAAPEPTADAAPSDATARAVEDLQAPELPVVELADGALSDADRKALETVRGQLEAALPEAEEGVAAAKRLVGQKVDALKLAKLELATAKSEEKAAKAALKAYEANPAAADGAKVRGRLQEAELAVDARALGVKVAQLELVYAKARQAHAGTLLEEDQAKLEEAKGRLDGADEKIVGKLATARVKADKAEAVAREKASKALLALEKAKSAK